MKPTQIATLAVAVLLACGTPIVWAGETALEGTYTAKGLNPDGSEYHRIVRIVKRGESFLVAWILAADVDGAVLLVPKSAGVGVARGGMFAVSYYGQDVTGVILYQIEEGGERLVGRWVTADGDGAVCSETLTRVRDPAAPAATPDTASPQPPPRRPAAPPRAVVAR